MSQADILNFLDKKKGWMATEEIVIGTKLNYGAAIRALNAMLKFHEVMRRVKKYKKNYAIYRVYLWKSQ
ncbi:MAG TPA: hypothetical protein ENH99_02445 [Candidatus Pacearchaeota archaeon]|nr:hypothetical protein [Candidatus Pacearchaeota archaeon]